MRYREVEKMVLDFGLTLVEDENPQDYECDMIFVNVEKNDNDPTEFIEKLLELGGRVETEECFDDCIVISFETFVVEINFHDGMEKRCEWLKEPEDETDWAEEERLERWAWFKDQLGWC